MRKVVIGPCIHHYLRGVGYKMERTVPNCTVLISDWYLQRQLGGDGPTRIERPTDALAYIQSGKVHQGQVFGKSVPAYFPVLLTVSHTHLIFAFVGLLVVPSTGCVKSIDTLNISVRNDNAL